MQKSYWKLYCFLCYTLVTGFSLSGQEAFEAVKIYGDFHLGKPTQGEPDLFLGRFNTNNFKGATIAYLWVNPNKKHSKELEIGIRSRTRNISFDSLSFAIKDFEAAIRFELGIRLKKKIFNYLTLSLNPAIDFYFYNGDAEPKQGSDFPINSTEGGILFSFIPHLEIPLGKRLFLDVNINIINFSADLNSQQTFNPNLSEDLQKFETFNFSAPGERSFQVGLGYRLFFKKTSLP